MRGEPPRALELLICGTLLLFVLFGCSFGGGSSNATVAVAAISLDKATDTVTVGSVDKLNATIVPADATNKSLFWSTNNASIATVSSNGLVTGVAAGSTTITVTTVDGGKTATCAVTVVDMAVSGVSLSKSVSTIYVGGTDQLIATIAPTNATNLAVIWHTSDASVATVSTHGLVAGVSMGTAKITVTTVDGGYTADCTISVIDSGTITVTVD
jgi:uncharacterized protein YjdB